jgi:phage-related protein
MDDEKPLYWVGSSLADLRALPAEVKDVFGYALHLAQWGDKHPDAKLISEKIETGNKDAKA